MNRLSIPNKKEKFDKLDKKDFATVYKRILRNKGRDRLNVKEIILKTTLKWQKKVGVVINIRKSAMQSIIRESKRSFHNDKRNDNMVIQEGIIHLDVYVPDKRFRPHKAKKDFF